MNRGDHQEIRKQPSAQWQPQQQSPYLQQGNLQQQQQQQQQQQGYAPQRPLHPSATSPSPGNRSISPQPSSPVSSGMHINTKPGQGPPPQQQRSNPNSPATAAGNVMEIAARHYEALQAYLLAHILKEKQGVSEQRIAAREKLSRLLQNQLQDLSTDVYDELKRRTDGNQVPFLAVRDDYHPKRNQARQKLATLPQNRFKDLASDVYVQLERQFPSLMEMFPLKALEEKEFLNQPPASPVYNNQNNNNNNHQQDHKDRHDREPTTPVVQQSSVVPNMATFTIQDSSNVEEETYYRAPGNQQQQSQQQQQGPVSPSALDGNVNFASLDSLMADLGGMVSKDGGEASKGHVSAMHDKGMDKKDANELIRLPSKGSEKESKGALNGLGIDTNSALDSSAQEYETRIAALCKRLQHLESEVGDGINRPEGSRLLQVERQLAKQTELYNDQGARLSKLQVEYNKILNDYHAQLETVDMVNQEVKSLVMEMKNIKQRHLDAEEELQLAYNRIKQLEDENGDIKADLEDALHNNKKIQEENSALAVRSAPSQEQHVAAPIATPIPANAAPNGLHNMNSQQQQQTVNDLHHDQHSDHEHDHDHRAKDPEDDWNQGRQQARDSTLVNPNSVIHQLSLNSFRNAVDDLLSAGRSDSSSAVLLGMKSVVIACKAVTEDVEDYEHDVTDDDGFTDLKQELSAGLTQLMTAAKVHSNAFNEDEDEFERTLTDMESAADQLEAIVMDIVNVPKHSKIGNNNGSSSNGHSNNNNNMNGHPYHDDDARGQKSEHHGDEIQNSHQHGHQDSMDYGSNDEPMEAPQLKVYLETQTGLIVSSIQKLIGSLRTSSDADEILDASDKITKVVDQVIRTTRMTLSTPELVSAPQAVELRSQGEMVLEDLENSLDLLNEMKEQIDAEPEMAQGSSAEAKAVKQKMASASFDIAKYTKELVSLIED